MNYSHGKFLIDIILKSAKVPFIAKDITQLVKILRESMATKREKREKRKFYVYFKLITWG